MSGTGTDALSHLFLHEQHEPVVGRINGPVETPDQSIQQWPCDVVRNVRHHFGRLHAVGKRQRNIQNVSLTERKAGLRTETLPQTCNQIAVQLNGVHPCRRTPEQSLGQRTPTRPHLQDTVTLCQFGSLENPIQNAFITEPVLTEPFTGRMSCEAHVMRAMGSLCTSGESEQRDDAVVQIRGG